MAEEKQGEGRFSRSDILGALGLVAFFAAVGIACYLAWPFLSEAYEAGGVQGIINRIHGLGGWGIFALLAMQVLQIVVAFIPGELVQVAAGMLYGPWGGTALILIGCVMSSALIFALVRKLGAPFVRDMVGEEHLESFRRFEASGKLDWIVFLLFLIPGLPKDTFTYLVPLTDMDMRRFLTLTTVGRIPGVFVSTFAANDIASGNYLRAGIVFVIGGAIALVGVLNRDRLMELAEKFRLHRGGQD